MLREQSRVSAVPLDRSAPPEMCVGSDVVYLGLDDHFGMVGTVARLRPGGGCDGSDAAEVEFTDSPRKRLRKIIRFSMLAVVSNPQGGDQ